MAAKRLIVVAILCLIPGLAAADDDFARPGWYAGLGGTYAPHWFPGNFDSDVTGGAAVKTENSAGMNIRGGYRFNSWAAAELEYEWIAGFENKVGGSQIFDLAYHTVTGNGKFVYPGWGRYQPYGLVGIGFSVLDLSDQKGVGTLLDGGAVGFATRFGAGIDVYLSENWLLNAALELQINTAKIDNSNPLGNDVGSLFYVPVQFGIQYRF